MKAAMTFQAHERLMNQLESSLRNFGLDVTVSEVLSRLRACSIVTLEVRLDRDTAKRTIKMFPWNVPKLRAQF